jgi:hypothetical protein
VAVAALPGAVAGGPLAAGAVLAIAIGAARVDARAAWLGTGALLAFLALDSVADLDRRLQAWTGIAWERIYLPVLAVGALAWLGAIASMRRRGAAALLIAGILSWLLAQAVWVAAWRGHVMPGEGGGMLDEALELAGAALIALGLLGERQALGREEERAPAARWFA